MALTSNPVGPEIGAAQSFVLSCVASGGTGVYTYQWSSTCTGGCVLTSGNRGAPVLIRDAARSSDSGRYNCSVTDNAGNSGINSSEIQVTGKYTTMITPQFHLNNVYSTISLIM